MLPRTRNLIRVSVFLPLATVFLLCASAREAFPQAAAAWKTTAKDGVQWLVTPDGKLFYSKGVNIVFYGRENNASRRMQSYFWGNFFPSLDAWRQAVGEQLAGWGFNTRGGWSDPSPAIGLPLMVDLELGRNSMFHWFDPFDPAMEETTLKLARELTAPYRNDPLLIGYFSDNEVGWWNSPLFVWYLKADWRNHTKQALWQMLYSHYDGRWERLLVDWVPQGTAAGFEDLKNAGACLKLRPGGQGIQVVDRFMVLCAHRYYQLMSKAIKQAHPGALYLGDRLPLYYHQDAVLAMGDSVDVISTNYNIDVPDGWIAPYFFDGLKLLSGKPVLVTEFFFAAAENRSGNRNETARNPFPNPGHLMTVATQAERAWGASRASLGFARFSNVVGAHWFQYCDEPLGGRDDGEDYNMGLIDNMNRPYEDVTEMFRSINPVLDRVHREAGSPPDGSRAAAGASHGKTSEVETAEAKGEAKGTASGDVGVGDSNASPEKEAPAPVERASLPIDVRDRSFLDWDKERTRLTGFRIERPRVPFGDVHLAWDSKGLYYMSLVNTFVNPGFLAYEGGFPLSESFQLHFYVAAPDGKTAHFTVYLVPQPSNREPDGFEVIPRLTVQMGEEPTELLETEGMVQRIHRALPHMMLEGFIPAGRLGLECLEAGMKLKANVLVQSYYREMTMTWSGPPDLQSARDPGHMREVVLANSASDPRSLREARTMDETSDTGRLPR